MSRLSFLFEGGVESAGGIVELICVFVIIALALGVYFIAQVVVLALVLVVLAIFSGGASIKYLRSTVIEQPAQNVDVSSLDAFILEQGASGRFVYVHSDAPEHIRQLSDHAFEFVAASRAFRVGVMISYLAALIFTTIEIVWRVLFGTWMTNFYVLLFLGLAFVIGTLVLDAGVILRRLVARSLDRDSQSSRESP